jgi:cAMP-dependent protein kinase regulator
VIIENDLQIQVMLGKLKSTLQESSNHEMKRMQFALILKIEPDERTKEDIDTVELMVQENQFLK